MDKNRVPREFQRKPDGRRVGYTFGMKTAISIPDAVFDEAERLARRVKTTRSELYSRALREYVARHAPDHVTEAMDLAIRESGQPADAYLAAAAQKTLRRNEW